MEWNTIAGILVQRCTYFPRTYRWPPHLPCHAETAKVDAAASVKLTEIQAGFPFWPISFRNKPMHVYEQTLIK